MLVSIIIPAYNSIKFIRNCVYSAVGQEFDREQFEVIVVDDGSTDDTFGELQLIQSMNSDIMQLFKKENGGPASALNVGIRMARGEWIKWLSSDDVLKPNALEIFFAEPREKGCIYYTNYEIIDENGNFKKEFIEPGWPEEKLWEFFFGNGSSSFIHRSVFDTCGLFDESLPASEDYEFWLRATMLYGVKMRLIPKITLQYRNHPGQLTHKMRGKYDMEIKQAIKARL